MRRLVTVRNADEILVMEKVGFVLELLTIALLLTSCH